MILIKSVMNFYYNTFYFCSLNNQFAKKTIIYRAYFKNTNH